MKIQYFVAKVTTGFYLSEYFVFPQYTLDKTKAVKLTAKQWAKIEAVYASSPAEVAQLTPFKLETV